MAEILDQIRIIIEQIVSTLGYPGITFVMFAENIFPPIPSELVMPFAGFLVVDGNFSLVGSIVAGTLGSVIGAIVLYYIGVWADERVIRSFLRRYGRYLTVSESELDRVLDLFGRYGSAIVFFGRLIPIIRSLISLPAGMKRMPLPRFLIFTTLGSSIWTTVLTVSGYFLGENWGDILGYVDKYQKVTLVVLACVAAGYVVMRLRDRRLNPPETPVTRRAEAQYD